jgi:hypothetical protein
MIGADSEKSLASVVQELVGCHPMLQESLANLSDRWD